MINVAAKLWHLPKARKDLWTLRLGLILASVTLIFSLVSQYFVSVVMLSLSAVMCLFALRETLRSCFNELDDRYSSVLCYRIVRWTLGAVCYCFALMVGAVLGFLIADTSTKRHYSSMTDMPEPNVDAIWESDPTRYYEQSAPNPFDR